MGFAIKNLGFWRLTLLAFGLRNLSRVVKVILARHQNLTPRPATARGHTVYDF
jgi:hypothetical protein